MPDDYRRSLLAEIHATVVERFGPGVAAGLQPTQQVVAALITADRYDDVVTFAQWETGIALQAVPEGVEWQDGTLRIALRAEFTSGGEPLTFPAQAGEAADGPPLDVPEAIAWVCADSAARFGKASGDLLLRERASSAQHFQPVRVTRETVPDGDGGRARLVLRVTATVDPGTAAGGVPPIGGLWDAFVRVRLGGWTKECRLGPAPAHDRPTPQAAVAADRTVLPYWTRPHGNLALAVDRAPERLGLDRVTPGAVTVLDGRLRATVPLYVPGDTKVLLRFGSGRIVDVPGVLSPAADRPGAVLEAELPVAELRGANCRVAVSLVPGADEPRFLVLPFALRTSGDTVRVVRAPNPGGLERLARRARRKLGSLLRGAASRVRNRKK
jgi:hypothetical protein